ncbi:glycosyl transferase [Paraburkholderia dinghuensis]|uniref:Glycosyl transferase n=1 Tax=Paraburkholderia dinghuensis TaxID=2305225 RepID=A0A3N6NF19_9BURK|nr:glycosyl transferase [Paraburkholderia dinghuensis]RQH10061.1 glycosyl transferase [Paraburkholderia dinghuensis]
MTVLPPADNCQSTAEFPRVLFFNVNGSGMGHLNRCLSYARRLRGRARPVFFSLASAIEIIEEMGFEADYFVSPYWSSNSTFAWNSELAVRFGMVLERVRPDAIVFDGTWPFQGFLAACEAYGSPALVWSNRGLLKEGAKTVPVDEARFDLVIQPGELGAHESEVELARGGKRAVVPPVCLLEDDEVLDRAAARGALSLPQNGRFVLFALGPGNLKDVAGIGHGLIRLFESAGFQVVWVRAPISVRDVELPPGVLPLTVYPLARYLRAFDAFVGAAGYNACCELVQSGVPSLLVPNGELADDQTRRARMVADVMPAVVSACETDEQRGAAVGELLEMLNVNRSRPAGIPLNGASLAAEKILALAMGRERRH